MSEMKDTGKSRVVRNAIILAMTALAFYVAFIVSMSMRG